MTIRFLRAARAEFRQATRHYESQRQGLGEEFADEIQATIDRIARQPESGHQISRNARRCLVRRFPYGVVYQVHPDHVLVVSITHLHRDPDHWKDRI